MLNRWRNHIELNASSQQTREQPGRERERARKKRKEKEKQNKEQKISYRKKRKVQKRKQEINNKERIEKKEGKKEGRMEGREPVETAPCDYSDRNNKTIRLETGNARPPPKRHCQPQPTQGSRGSPSALFHWERSW